jgi:hypothetical protein
MDAASAAQKLAVVAALHFPDDVYLHHVASGRRFARGALASAIRLATKRIKGGLPKVSQRDISKDCRDCEYAKRCEK